MSSQNFRLPIGPKTLNDIFFSAVDRDESRVMMRKTTPQWASLSSRDLYKHVVGVSRALVRWGLKRGDRIAILSENRPEWAVADFACLLLGAITVPIYTTLTEEQTAHVLCDSHARAIFASTEELVQRVLAIRRQTRLEKVVGMDHAEHQGIVRMSELTVASLPNANQLAHTLLELKPTIMVAVPRVYEKIHAQVDQKANAIPKKWIYGCALSVGRRHRPETVTGKTPRTAAWRVADRLVY